MAYRECSTQAEADAAAVAGDVIVWRAGTLRAYGSANLRARGSATVYARDSATVYASDSATVYAYGSATVYAYGSATVHAYGSATVYAYGSATVHAYGSATVHAYGSATVIAIGAATVIASDSATVTDGKTNAALHRDRPRLILGPLGSRRDTLGVSLPSDGSEPVVYAGCWSGRMSEFAARVDEVYPTGRYGDEYRATIAYIRAIAAIPQGGA
jgi:hypothetical protein